MGRQSKYPEEFRRNAAALVLDSGRSTRDVGRELGVNHETLRNWVQALRRERQDGAAAGAGTNASSWPGCAGGWPSWSWRRRSCEKPRSSSPGRRSGDPDTGLRVHHRGEDHFPGPSVVPGPAGVDLGVLRLAWAGASRLSPMPTWRTPTRPTSCTPPGSSTVGSMVRAG
jgi:hypothetical protein